MPPAAGKPVIAVDIDEVLFPMAPSLLTYYNDEHGTTYKLEQMTSYYLEDLTGDTREEMMEKIRAYLKTQHYTKGVPIQGAIDAIHRLREDYRLVLVTARDHFYRGSTEKFLRKHFAGLYDELYYTHHVDNPDHRTPKYAICEEINAVALIDDNLKYVIDCARHGIEGILFGDYPWNQAGHLPSGITRVADWPAVLRHFNEKGR